MEDLKELEKKAEIETLTELKKRKAIGTGREKAKKKVDNEEKSKAKKLRVEQLIGMGREALVDYSNKLGFRNVKWKVVDQIKRETKDIATLIYHKELELGGKDKALNLAREEEERRELLIRQRQARKLQKENAKNAVIRNQNK